MKYYGSNGQERAIADGYVPTTQEAMGHGTHYSNFEIFQETKNSEQIDITRPVGLNYDQEGNLIAVYYLREPLTQEATPDNPLAPLLVDPDDDIRLLLLILYQQKIGTLTKAFGLLIQVT